MRIIRLLFAFTLIVYATTLISCQSEESADVNQDRIFATYEVFYDANTDISYAKAQFRFGDIAGTTLKLSSPAEVRFNGDLLTFNETLAYYEKQIAGYVNGGEFQYKDTAGKLYVNAITNLKKPTIPSSFTQVDRSKANTFTWTGTPIENKELMVLDIFNTGQTNLQLFYQASVGTTSITLPINQLAILASGTNNATAVLNWSRTDALTQATAVGGYIKVTSKDKSKIISVIN